MNKPSAHVLRDYSREFLHIFTQLLNRSKTLVKKHLIPSFKQTIRQLKTSIRLRLQGDRMNMREYFKLFFINLWVSQKNLIEFLKVVYYYYRNFTFMRSDLSLILRYFFKNPFQISKLFLIARGEANIYAYGETPLTTMEHIVKQCELSHRDTVLELGCGRGRTCFWMRCFLNCKVIGIDYVPVFTTRANRIAKQLHLDKIEFRNEEICKTDLKQATVLYLYGTCLDDASIKTLTEKIEQLPSGTKVITVSYPLTDYTQKDLLEIMRIFPARFTWGTADVYLQYRK